MSKIIISGYYGFGNTGDEAILQGMVDSLKKEIPDVEILVLSSKPEKTAKTLNVKSINRTNYFDILKNIINCSLFISGGGGLIQDITSLKSLRYYLGLIQLAQFFRKPTMIYAQSIGPVTTPQGRLLAKKVCNKVNFITVRDKNSKELLQELGVNKPPIKVTADPVFALEPQLNSKSEILSKPECKIQFETSKVKIGISIRPWKSNVFYLDVLAQVLNYLIEKWNAYIVFLPFQLSQDLEICRILQNKMSSKTEIVSEELSPFEWLNLIKQFDFLIGMRLHALIMGAMSLVPMVGISYDPKVAGFLNTIDTPSIELNNLTAEDLISKLEQIKKNYNQVKTELEAEIPQFKEKALENVKVVKSLIEIL